MRTILALALALAQLTLASNALAQDAPAPAGGEADAWLPVAYARRPLTLPEMTLSPELNVQLVHTDFGLGGAQNAFSMELGASFGITEDLMVDARPLGFIAGDPDPDYTRFQVGVTYRFLDGPVEVGARFRFQIDSDGTLAFNPGLPVRIHAGDAVRIDTGLEFLGVVPTSGADPAAGLTGVSTDLLRPIEPGVPVTVAFNLVDEVFAGFTTGYGIASLEEPADSSFMPLGFFAGATVPGDDGPLVDLAASFGFPLFLFGVATENPVTELWIVGVTGRGFFKL